jgi:hypothetical protein
LRNARCPECGLEITPALLARLRPSRAMFRSAQAAVVLGPVVTLGDLFVHGPRVWQRPNAVGAATMIGAVAGATLVLVVWVLVERRIAAMPRHRQGRIATAAWAVLALATLAVLARP